MAAIVDHYERVQPERPMCRHVAAPVVHAIGPTLEIVMRPSLLERSKPDVEQKAVYDSARGMADTAFHVQFANRDGAPVALWDATLHVPQSIYSVETFRRIAVVLDGRDVSVPGRETGPA